MQNGLAQPMPWLAYPQGGNRKASDGRLARPTRRGALSGIGNWDQPKHTTCWGRLIWENPTYSAFWRLFGVTCLRLHPLASSVGFGDDGGIGTQEEPAVFRRKTGASDLLSPWKWRESNSPSPHPSPRRRGCPAVRRGQWLNARLVSYRFGRPGPPAWLSSGINLCGMRWAAKIGLAVCALLLVPPAGG
jgi:hypothetical protein